MTYYALVIAVGVWLIVILLVLTVSKLGELVLAQQDTATEIRELRLKARTRIAQADMTASPLSEEAQLARMGRSTRAKRVVVGGDEASELHTALTRQVKP